jgi:uncharacterized protein (DUF58 family)
VRSIAGKLERLTRTNDADQDGRVRVRGRAIYILPTRAGLVFAGVLLLMLLGSLNYQNNLALLFTVLMGSVAWVGMHHTWFNLRGLDVSARGLAPVFAGEEAGFDIVLADPGGRRRVDLRAALGVEGSRALAVEPGATGNLRLWVAAPARGRCVLPRFRLDTRYPLGLFRAWCYVRSRAEVTVYPRPARRSPVPLPMPEHRQSNQGDRGVGADDFVGLRGYRAGDSLRQVDWKALGRERGLVVKQFGGDRADQVWLDWATLPAVDIESRLSLLCRQVLDAAAGDLAFGLRLPGQDVPIGRGDAHRHRCLETLARYGHG